MHEIKRASKPNRLVKIWREIKRPLNSIFQRLNRQIRGLSPDEYDEYREQLTWRKSITIGADGRVNIPSVRFFCAYGCNLRCQFCMFSPFHTGIVPKEVLADSFEKWSYKISPQVIRLYGGEPLLNHDIADIVVLAYQHFPQSQYQIVTNGILFPRVSDDTLRIFKKYNVHIHISQHLDTEEYRDILKYSLSRLDNLHIQYIVEKSFRMWWKPCSIDIDGVPMPCNSDPKAAHRVCTAKRCTLIEGGVCTNVARWQT